MFPAVNHFKDPSLYLISKVPVSVNSSHTMVHVCMSVYMTAKVQNTTSSHVLQQHACTMKHSYDYGLKL
jgi:hypothetical protein